jgi:hypothetical protein
MDGDEASAGLFSGQMAHGKKTVAIGQIEQYPFSNRGWRRVTADEMTHCLQVATFPGESLATKNRYQIFCVIANEGDLSLLLLEVRAAVGPRSSD